MRSHLLPLLSLTLVAATAAILPGCGSTEPTIGSEPYRGPTVHLVETAGLYEVRLEAPSGGWTFQVDQVRQRRGGYDIFTTVRKPDGRYLHTQAFVTHRSSTTLKSQTPVSLYTRVLAAEDKADSQEYAEIPIR